MLAKNVYVEANNYVEMASWRTIILLYGVVWPCYIIPSIITSYFVYYTMDEPNGKAFILPAPAS